MFRLSRKMLFMTTNDFTHNVPNVNKEKVVDFIFDLLDTIMRIVDVQDCFSNKEYSRTKYLIAELKFVFKNKDNNLDN